MVDVVKLRRTFLLAMFCLAFGALFIHFNVHPPFMDLEGNGAKSPVFTNVVATVFGILDTFLVTLLFSRKKTASWAYMLNGMFVIYGTVMMGHCGIAKMYEPGLPLYKYLLIPTSPDIVIAWADFFLGSVLYRLWFIEGPSQATSETTPKTTPKTTIDTAPEPAPGS
jgi:hypothetical protein